jgi:hypothetical protein
MDKRFQTDFLFASPSFLSGAARVLDLGATFDSYNASSSDWEADSRAFNNDLSIVLQDFQNAVLTIKNRLSAE